MSDTLEESLGRAVRRELSVAELIRLADILKTTGRRDAAQALYATWIRFNADNPLCYAVLFNHAVLLGEDGNPEAARAALQQAIAANPDFLPPYINLGRIFEGAGATDAALATWRDATARLPSVSSTSIGYKTMALVQIARVAEAAWRDTEAEAALREAIEIDPGQREAIQHFLSLRQRQCEWPVVEPWERVPRETLLGGMSPLSMAAYTDDPMLQLATAWHYNKTDVGAPLAPPPDLAAARRPGRLRVGYLSSDLREHAVGFLMAEVFALHDRAEIEAFAYYCGPASDDAMHRRFRETAEHFVDLAGLDDVQAAARIAEDGIQILVDVNGYTREGRTKLLAQRPAPVIVNWLGYPGSLGSPTHHYIVADETLVPPGDEIYYSEKVLRLPCYQPNDRAREVAPARPTRAQAGLPDEAFVFCCFNGAHKITRFTFARWMRILAGVPGSVLWLLGSTGGAERNLRQAAEAAGIAPTRLIFAPKLAHAAHLARYPLADLFLDSAPYNAHTTSSDALWMGVPVLTFPGRSFPARVCASLVRSAGLAELVRADAEDFVATAIRLAGEPQTLAALRARLRDSRDSCVLFDTPLLVRSLEGLYREMDSDRRAGRLPQPDLAGLETYYDIGIGLDYETEETQTRPDYVGWWREHLARRHAWRPIPPDSRLAGKGAIKPAVLKPAARKAARGRAGSSAPQ